MLVTNIELLTRFFEENIFCVSFTYRKEDWPPAFLNGDTIPVSNYVKYLGLNIDRRQTWKHHIKLKRQHVERKTKGMYWFLGPKSQLNLDNNSPSLG